MALPALTPRARDAALLARLFAVQGRPVSLNDLGLDLVDLRQALQPYLDAGYPIQFHPHGEISLTEPPDIWCAEEILGRCPPAPQGPAWDPVLLHETASTNDVARAAARRGAQAGLVVAATRQTRGRGRLGRVWESSPGGGLYVSLLLRPDLTPAQAGQLTVLASVAAADAVETVSGLRPRIKWPNDLFLDGRKLGGLLLETETTADRLAFAVVGIGINVRQAESDFSPAVQALATSLFLATGQLFRRADLLIALLHAFTQRLAQPFTEVRAAWTESSLTLGQQVTLQTAHGRCEGQAIGLDPSGALQLRTATGEIETITAGDLLPIPSPPAADPPSA